MGGKIDRRLAVELAALADLYALIPEGNCQGKCQTACTVPIDIQPIEVTRIGPMGATIARAAKAAQGKPVQLASCPALDEAGGCTIYQDRPFICRFWGATGWMSCPHGCKPVGGYMSDVDGLVAMLRFMQLNTDYRLHADINVMIERVRVEPMLRAAWIWRLHVHANEQYPADVRREADNRLGIAIHAPHLYRPEWSRFKVVSVADVPDS